jgi:hypothetical protein
MQQDSFSGMPAPKIAVKQRCLANFILGACEPLLLLFANPTGTNHRTSYRYYENNIWRPARMMRFLK